MNTATLCSGDNWFEDFEVGQVIRHARGKTVTEMDNVLLSNLVMNTSEGHFNEEYMRRDEQGVFRHRVVFGGINLSLVLGLAAQDTAEHALRELTLDAIRLSHPVVHGDTLYAFSEVLEKTDDERADAGVIRFRHYGVNQHDKLCVEAERRVLLKRKSHWGER